MPFITKSRFEIPVGQWSDGRGKWVNKQLVEIKPVDFFWLIWAIYPIRVKLAGLDIDNPYMPDIARAVADGIKIDLAEGF